MLPGTKSVVVAVASVFLTVGAGLPVQKSVIPAQGIEMTKQTLRSTVPVAEATRQSASDMRTARIDKAGLKASAVGIAHYRQTNGYKTVPVVAAWDPFGDVVYKDGYEVRVPARSSRDPQNTPRPADAATSPSMVGKHMLGFPMEGWRAGNRHGIFLMRSKLNTFGNAVKAGMEKAAMGLLPLSLLIGLGVWFFISPMIGELQIRVRNLSPGSLPAGRITGENISAASAEIANSASAAAEMEQFSHRVAAGNWALAETSASVTDIRGSSERIAKVIKLIDEIAFQTNVLALNTAVEAGRAGASGARFAVFAEKSAAASEALAAQAQSMNAVARKLQAVVHG